MMTCGEIEERQEQVEEAGGDVVVQKAV